MEQLFTAFFSLNTIIAGLLPPPPQISLANFFDLQVIEWRQSMYSLINNTGLTIMKILVVHRQKLVADQIKSVLHDNSPVVIYTDSGLDGLLTSRIESFDLIICGTDLPVITGFELVRSVRTNSVNKNVPVIFIADVVDAKMEHLGNALGVAGMLSTSDVDNRLSAMVHDNVKPEPDKNWQDIIARSGWN